MALLHIFDGDDSNIAATAKTRTILPTDLKIAITSNGSNLLSSLDALVTAGKSFDRILFETHGSPGSIYFGKASVSASWALSNMAGRRYSSLCPTSTRLYFNGCNVAEGPAGRTFLTNMARVFLTTAGGSVFGHTSLGWEVPLWSHVTGHVVHVGGDTITLFIAPGGGVVEGFTQSDL